MHSLLPREPLRASKRVMQMHLESTKVRRLVVYCAFTTAQLGTILDRVDYNMNVTHKSVVDTKDQLKKAADYQDASSFQLCVLLLIVMVVGFVIALMVKVALSLLLSIWDAALLVNKNPSSSRRTAFQVTVG
jgi:Na+/H+ antiporter NhaD/arsenite permease-like protein